MTESHRILLILILTSLLGACAIKVPMTRNEFVNAVKKGEGPTKYESTIINYNIRSLVDFLNKKSNLCLNKVVRRSMSGPNYAEASETYYNAKTVFTSKSRAEFTLQLKHIPRPSRGQPADGLYAVAIDLTAINNKQTQVDAYKPTFAFTDIGNAIHSWALGKDTTCPDLK